MKFKNAIMKYAPKLAGIGAGVLGTAAVASADVTADLTSIFSAAETSTLETSVVALLIGFIGIGVVVLGYTYVMGGLRKGKGAIR
jgi:hypothetical protein